MPAPSGPVLTRATLNRALLARQHLLHRVERPVPDTIDHLVGMQAQNPLDPYVGLWARLAGFAPGDLAPLVEERRAVRLSTLRGTVHLHTAADALGAWPLLRGVQERIVRSTSYWRATADIDLPGLLAAARRWLVAAPRTEGELRTLIAARLPAGDAPSLARVVRYQLPLIQVPPRGVWGRSLRATWAPLDHSVGRPLVADPSPQELVLRYLAAFGPASVADIAAWSRLTGVRELIAPVRDRLVTFVHEDTGRELLDLPDAPRPGPDVDAPVRFLPEYDNVLLAHADRSRIAPVEVPESVLLKNGSPRFLLVDGLLAGVWRIERAPGRAELVVRRFAPWARARQRAVVAEGEALLAFAAADAADHAVTVVAA